MIESDHHHQMRRENVRQARQTVRVETKFHVCPLCGTQRQTAAGMDIHFTHIHEDEVPTYDERVSIYEQFADAPVRHGDRVLTTINHQPCGVRYIADGEWVTCRGYATDRSGEFPYPPVCSEHSEV